MTMKIGSARIDENAKLKNGKAGDQTGKEVSTQDYYMHSKGWYLLRPKSIEHADKLSEAMVRACNNKNLGYDQNQRLGVITHGTDTKVKTECDCSSLVRQCIIEATKKDPGNFTTDNAVRKIEATGLFNKHVGVTSNTILHNGDILCTKTKGHIVIVVAGNRRVELEIDGLWGKDTTTKAQEVFGTTIDGIVSNQYKRYKDDNPGLLSATFEWKNNPKSNGSSLIRAMKRFLNNEINAKLTVNGHVNVAFIKAMQKWLGTVQDGHVSKPSSMVKAFQKWLNTQ